MVENAILAYRYVVLDFPLMTVMAEFEELTGGDIKQELIPYTFVDKDGMAIKKYSLGATSYQPIKLTHALNSNGQALNNWLNLAVGGQLKAARKNITIIMLDLDQKPIVKWNLTNALPTEISGFSFNQHLQANAYYICHELSIQAERIEMQFM